MRTIHTAILHCAAVPAFWHIGKTVDQMRDEIKRWHVKDRGWKDIGYHYVVAPSGSVALGRPLSLIGAHTHGFNVNTVGILLIESQEVSKIRTFDDYFTQEQRIAVRALCAGLGVHSVRGHNNFANKLCPGFSVKTEDWL